MVGAHGTWNGSERLRGAGHVKKGADILMSKGSDEAQKGE